MVSMPQAPLVVGPSGVLRGGSASRRAGLYRLAYLERVPTHHRWSAVNITLSEKEEGRLLIVFIEEGQGASVSLGTAVAQGVVSVRQ